MPTKTQFGTAEYNYIYYSDFIGDDHVTKYRVCFIPASTTAFSAVAPTMVKLPSRSVKIENLNADGGFENNAVHGLQQTSSFKFEFDLTAFDMSTVDATAGRINWSMVRQQIMNGVHCDADNVPELVTIGDKSVYLPNVYFVLSNNGDTAIEPPDLIWFVGVHDKKPETNQTFPAKQGIHNYSIELLSVHRWLCENVGIDDMINATDYVEHAFDVFYKYAHSNLSNKIRVNYKLHQTPDTKCYYQSMNQTLDKIETVSSLYSDKIFRLNSGHPLYNDSGIKFGYNSPLNNIKIYKQDDQTVNDRSFELSDMSAVANNMVNDNVKFIVKLDKKGFNIGGLFSDSSENSIFSDCSNAWDFLKYVADQMVIKGIAQTGVYNNNLPCKPQIKFYMSLKSTINGSPVAIDVNDIIGDAELSAGFNLINKAISNYTDIGETTDDELEIGDVDNVTNESVGILSEKSYETKQMIQNIPTTCADLSQTGSSDVNKTDFGTFKQYRHIVRNMYYERPSDQSFAFKSLIRCHDAVALYIDDAIYFTHDQSKRIIRIDGLPFNMNPDVKCFLPNTEPNFKRDHNESGIRKTWFLDYVNWTNNVQKYSGIGYVSSKAILYLYGNRNQYLLKIKLPSSIVKLTDIGERFAIDLNQLTAMSPAWSQNYTYYTGDNVDYYGVKYICLNDGIISATTPDVDLTNWSSTESGLLTPPFRNDTLILTAITNYNFKQGIADCEFFCPYY